MKRGMHWGSATSNCEKSVTVETAWLIGGTTGTASVTYYDYSDDGVMDGPEVLQAVRDYFDGLLTDEEILAVTECYFSTSSHNVILTDAADSVDEGSSLDITLEMSQPNSKSTIEVPIVVVGGDSEATDFGFMRGMTRYGEVE